MIHLRCAKKLLAKLPLDERGRLRGASIKEQSNAVTADNIVPLNTESPLSGWHANLLTLQRRQCVLMVHDTTRFPVFIPALKKADFAELAWHFTDVFMNTLLKVGANETQMQNAHNALADLVCDNHCDRSVQGTMNQMAQDIELKLQIDNIAITELGPYSTSAWLADRPCTVKGVKDCVWPIKAMLALIENALRNGEGDSPGVNKEGIGVRG